MSIAWSFDAEQNTIKNNGVIPSISSLNAQLKNNFDKLHADVQTLNSQLASANTATNEATTSTNIELRAVLDTINSIVQATSKFKDKLEELEKTVVGPSTNSAVGPSANSRPDEAGQLLENAKTSATRATQLLSLSDKPL